MNNQLNTLAQKYYEAHNISKTVNILDVAKMDAPDASIKPLKCISNFLEPVNGWPKNALNTTSEEAKCFYCSTALHELFSDYKAKINNILPPAADNKQCQYCYWFCCKKYVAESSQIKLAKKFVKVSKLK